VIRRPEGSDFLLIRQIDHAHLAASLMEALDPKRVRLPAPRAAFLEAVRRHDDGWRDEDRRPRIDPRRGLPYHFSEVPIAIHLAIWRTGIRRALSRRPYAALLMSLHVIGLYDDFFRPAERTADERRLVSWFYDEQGRVQRALIARLSRRPSLGRAVSGEALAFARRWLRVADGLSLQLCCGPIPSAAVSRPDRPGEPLRLVPRGEREFAIEPWLFRRRSHVFTVRARSLGAQPSRLLEFRAAAPA
jgi:hypothetical protein